MLPKEIIDEGFPLPFEYHFIFSRNLTNIAPWFFLESPLFIGRGEGINLRYPSRVVIPFAYRNDNDDNACLVVESSITGEEPNDILIIHDFASPGWEVEGKFKSFVDWYSFVLKEILSIEKENHTHIT